MRKITYILAALLLLVPSKGWAPVGEPFPTWQPYPGGGMAPFNIADKVAIGQTPGGSGGIVLNTDGTAIFAGTLYAPAISPAPTGTDNLGDHTATENLNMAGFAITNVGTMDGVDLSGHAGSTSAHHDPVVALDFTAITGSATDPQVPDDVAGVVQGDREVVLGGIEFDLATEDDLFQQRHGALLVNDHVAREDAIRDGHHGFVLVTALAHDDLLHVQLLGRCRVLQRDSGQLDVVIKQAIVDTIVSDLIRCESPLDSCRIEYDCKCTGVLRPRQDFACVVDEEHICILFIPRRGSIHPGHVLHVLIDEFDIVLYDLGVHSG